MRIYLPLFRDNLKDKVFDLSTEQNPGVGGTQHVAIVLACRLAKAMPQWKIFLVNTSPIALNFCPENLEVLEFRDFTTFCDYITSRDSQNTRAIIPESLLSSLSSVYLNSIANMTFCWLHHPFRFVESLRKASFLAYVCVGEYQFRSVGAYYPNTVMVQNVFSLPCCTIWENGKLIKESPSLQHPLSLVHLGALVPGKGFLHIAQQWKSIKKQFPNALLHVIGSSSTYSSRSDVHSLIPTTHDFASKILKYIPTADIIQQRVVFHGNMGVDKDKVISSAHLAIQNPTGASEAFPASPLECMALGTPVIASADFGMNDAMKYFHELTVGHPSEICQLIANAIDSPHGYRALVLRSLAVASFFSCKSDESVEKWIQLILQEKSYSVVVSSKYVALRAVHEWITLLCRRAKYSLRPFINSF